MAQFITLDDGELNETIGAVAAKLGNLAPAMKEVGEYMLLATRERFDRQQDPMGRPWTALSPRYAQRKASNPRALRGILTLRGILRDTITYQARPDSVVIGSNLLYAAIHQLGGPTGRGGTMPDRAFLGASDRERVEIAEILRGYLNG